MHFLTLTLFPLCAITAASNSAQDLERANLIPRSTWQAWQKRSNILVGGGWPLLATTCPTLSTQCTDGTCCPNSLVCDPTSGAGFDVRAACCPDCSLAPCPFNEKWRVKQTDRKKCIAQDCTTALTSTPFCADDSWELWETSLGNNSYFCCLPGQIGLQSLECVSGKQVIDPSLTATNLGIVTSGAVFQSGIQTKSIVSVSSLTGSTGTATITAKPTATSSGGSSIESGVKSIVSGLTHNGGNNMRKGVAVYAVEGILGAIVALLL
jgi:hypothetical protein